MTIPSIHVLTLSPHIIAALISRSLFLIPYIATRAVPNCVNSSQKIADVLSVTYSLPGIRTLVVYLEGIEPSDCKNFASESVLLSKLLKGFCIYNKKVNFEFNDSIDLRELQLKYRVE